MHLWVFLLLREYHEWFEIVSFLFLYNLDLFLMFSNGIQVYSF